MSTLEKLDTDTESFRNMAANFNSVLSEVGNLPFSLISINGQSRTGIFDYFIRYLTFKSEMKGLNSSSSASAESWMKLKTTAKFVRSNTGIGLMTMWYLGVNSTIRIDLWPEPFILKVDGREVAVLLMDCRCLFDDDLLTRQSAILFSFTSLCSSTSIFNLDKSIDESILQQIFFFSKFAPRLEEQNGEEGSNSGHPDDQDEETTREKQISCQRLLFRFWNFHLPSKYAYGYHGNDTNKMGGKNYCRDVFGSYAESKRPPENALVRQRILESYKEVGCFLMPQSKYQYVDGVLQQTDEQFDKYMKEFVELVLSPQNLVTKRLKGEEITGNGFIILVGEWAKLLDDVNKNFPVYSPQSTATIRHSMAHNTALTHYKKAINSFFQAHPREPAGPQFLSYHKNLKLEALQIFDSIKKVGGEELSKKCQSFLLEDIDQMYESKRQLSWNFLFHETTDEELEKNQPQAASLQQEMSDLKIQSKQVNEGPEKVIRELKEQIKEDSRPTKEQLEFYQGQLSLAESKYEKVTKSAEENKRILLEQIQTREVKFQERERRQQETLEHYKREIESLKATSPKSSSSESQPAASVGSEKRETYNCTNMRVLFINQKFDSPEKSNRKEYTERKRSGADADGQNVTNLFQKTLGMKLDVEENVASDEISVILKRFKRKCIAARNDGCIVIISTHGIDPHFLLMDDLKLINLEKLVIQKFGRDEFREFNGKPKIFLFNACRIERTNVRQIPEFIEEDSTSCAMSYSDILIGKSTLPLFPSYRHAKEGSFYLKYLHDVCLENGGKSLEIQDLLNNVGRKVAEQLEKFGNAIQIPPIELRLFTKNLYLKPQNT